MINLKEILNKNFYLKQNKDSKGKKMKENEEQKKII